MSLWRTIIRSSKDLPIHIGSADVTFIQRSGPTLTEIVPMSWGYQATSKDFRRLGDA